MVNNAVEIINLSMDESFSKENYLGSRIDEPRSAGVGRGLWGAPAISPVSKKVKRPTKLILKPRKPTEKKGASCVFV